MLSVPLQLTFCFLAVIFFTHFLTAETSEPAFPIINAHEHIQSSKTAALYRSAARANGITHTVILGSPEAALVPGKKGFHHADSNNRRMLQLARRYPREYSLFVTVDPEDPAHLEKLKNYIRWGAKGLKLYSGHSAYHSKPMDDPAMFPVFDFCERQNIPVIMHVNPGLYQTEFEHILKQYPRLKVVCPHYCLSTVRKDRLEELMARYPNLYLDTSFGFLEFLKEGLLRFSANPQGYRDLLIRYQDRILFGLDLVVNGEHYKSSRWYGQMIGAYRDLLEKEEFFFAELPGKRLRGMHLDRVILRKIYSANFQRFLLQRAASNATEAQDSAG